MVLRLVRLPEVLRPGDDDVARAHVSVHQPVAVQHGQRFAHLAQPAENQLLGLLVLVLGEQWDHAAVVGERRALDPRRQGNELVVPPLRRDFEDGGKPRVSAHRLPSPSIALANLLAGRLVAHDLADERAHFPSRGVVEFDHLEGGSHSPRPQASHHAVGAVPEAHFLILGPEPSRGNSRSRNLLPKERCELACQLLQRRTVLRRPQPSRKDALDLGRLPAVAALVACEEHAEGRAQGVDVGALVRGGQAVFPHLRRNAFVVLADRVSGEIRTVSRRGANMLESGEDRRVVVLHQDRPRRQVPVHQSQPVGRFMKLLYGNDRLAGEVEALLQSPRLVGSPLLGAGHGRVHDREELHLAAVPRGVLKRVQDPGRPPEARQLMVKRVVLAPRRPLRTSRHAGGHVVQVEEHPILSRRMHPLVDAVKRFFLRRLQLEVHVAGEPPERQRAVDGDAASGRQLLRQPLHLLRRKHRRLL